LVLVWSTLIIQKQTLTSEDIFTTDEEITDTEASERTEQMTPTVAHEDWKANNPVVVARVRKETSDSDNSTDECNSSDDGGILVLAGCYHEDDDMDDIEYTTGTIAVPGSGIATTRHVPNGCAICLCPFGAQDCITWSSNTQCQHVFHKACILDWLKASGRRHLRSRRRNEQRDHAGTVVVNYANDPLLKLTRFPMLCPCCRQEFLVVPEIDDEQQRGLADKDATAATAETDEATPATSSNASTASSRSTTVSTTPSESNTDAIAEPREIDMGFHDNSSSLSACTTTPPDAVSVADIV
jgi:hypothetical protein